MKKVLVFKSLYVLFIYLLLENNNETIFLTSSTVEENILNKLKNKIVIKEFNYSYNYLISKIQQYFFIQKIRRNKKILQLILNKNIRFYGQDNILLGNLCLNNEFYLIEEGSMNYSFFSKKNSKLKKWIRKYILNQKEIMGQSDVVKKIYLTGLAPIPEEIKDKVEIINLKELWDKKIEEEKKEILDIFGFNNLIIERLKNKKEILYTQPLSEDAVITEEEKIGIYTKVIKNYKKETLVIKQHPREKTDYKKIFPNIEILNQSFPAELFSLLDIKFEKAITLFSTAVLSNKNIEVDFYGTEVHPKILKRFGQMNNIMQTNAFIKEENDE